MKREIRLFDEIEKFSKGQALTNAMALTFGYDGDVAYERIWKPLIERFSLPHPLVIADGDVDEGRALGVTVLRFGRAQGLFHPKLFIAIRDEAVFVAVGSANLTKGGLGANLELLTSMAFGPEVEKSGSRALLAGVADFVEKHVLAHIVANAKTFEELERLCRLLRIVEELLPKRERGGGLSFVHSAATPLFDQLRTAHTDQVNRMVVVSPFWEIDHRDAEAGDSTLLSAFESLAWSKKATEPRCLLHASAADGALRLPKAAIESLGAGVELRLQALFHEPRRLHAKLIALFGPRRTTLLWGSPNFTPAALLRAAGSGGNVETGLMLCVEAKTLSEATLLEEFELSECFAVHSGEIPEPPPFCGPPTIDFILGELHYDPRSSLLSLHGAIVSDRVHGLEVRIAGDVEPLLTLTAPARGPIRLEREVNLQRIEDSGLRVLRSLYATLILTSATGEVLSSYPVRFNVAFTDALEVWDNVLLGADAVSADALLLPPWVVPERRIAALEAKLAAIRASSARPGGHQPSLDLFYRNVRKGLEARRRELDHHRGSRFGLMRWSLALRNALEKARDEGLDGARKVYFVSRVSEHVLSILDALPKWNPQGVGPDLVRVLEPAKLARALEEVSLEATLIEAVTHGPILAQRSAVQRLERLA